MNQKMIHWILVLVLCLALVSCVQLKQPSPNIEYYTLEYESPELKGLDPLHAVIRVLRFSVAPPYDTYHMIYRNGDFVRKADPYHKWRANPGDLVSYFFARDLIHAGLFDAVLPYESKIPSSYLLEGLVDEFFEWDSDASWMAVLTVTITLVAENEPNVSRRVLFQKTYRKKEPCKQKTPRSLAEAMSEAMALVSAEMSHDIYRKIAP